MNENVNEKILYFIIDLLLVKASDCVEFYIKDYNIFINNICTKNYLEH
jgi:hypothetical protein